LFIALALVGVNKFKSLEFTEITRRDYHVYEHEAVINDDKYHLMQDITNSIKYQNLSTRSEVIHRI